MDTTRNLTFVPQVDGAEADISHLALADFVLPYVSGKAILDVGCWTGSFFSALNAHNSSRVGVDLALIALRQARRVIPDANFSQASALRLPFGENHFDVVCFWEVLEHLPVNTEVAALKEIRRVLRPDGYLLLSTPNSHWLANLLDPAYWLIAHRHYRPADLRRMLEQTGFAVERLEVRAGGLALLHTNIFYISKHILRQRLPQPEWYRSLRLNDYKREAIVDIFVAARRRG